MNPIHYKQPKSTQVNPNKMEDIKPLLQTPVPRYVEKDYNHTTKTLLMTSRFTTETYEENCRFRQHIPFVCVYNVPKKIKESIPRHRPMYVLEMNNTTNQIMGIGKILNVAKPKENYVHEVGNYNRYSYSGTERVDRHEMTDEELKLIQVLDCLCFHGRAHLKRHLGITQFPIRTLYQIRQQIDVLDIIHSMFDRKYKKP
jgi:hypothetical protein